MAQHIGISLGLEFWICDEVQQEGAYSEPPVCLTSAGPRLTPPPPQPPLNEVVTANLLFYMINFTYGKIFQPIRTPYALLPRRH